MKNILKLLFTSSRAKSFYWRAGVGIGILFTGHVVDVLPDMQLPEFVAVVIAYVLNEITKWLNTKKK